MVDIKGNESWSNPPAYAVTQGPKHHFFGYYDKCPWDGSGRYLLSLETSFIDRPPAADDVATVGVIDLQNGNRFRPLAQTRAWNWQQGAMLHWLPVPHTTGAVAEKNRRPSTPYIIHNDRLEPGEEPKRPSRRGWDGNPADTDKARFVAVVREAATGDVVRTLPLPVYALSRDGKAAVTLNFSRLQKERPGYGYAGVPDPWEGVDAPENDGIYWMDVETGEHKLVISLAQVAALEPKLSFAGAVHRFNHLQFSPDDGRFIFLHRWREKSQMGHLTRLMTAKPDGGDIAIVASHDFVSHFDWRDSEHVLAWARYQGIGDRYFVYRDGMTDEIAEIIGDGTFTKDGHCNYSPDGRWLLTDEYPRPEPYRPLILWHLAEKQRVDIGKFYSPPELDGEIRCDLHPRWSRDGTKICFDSAHEGQRQVYVMDVSEVVGEKQGAEG